jgi:hypothetical protein
VRFAFVLSFVLVSSVASATQYISAPTCPNTVKEAAKSALIDGIACLKKLNTPQALDHARRLIAKTSAESGYKIRCDSADKGTTMAMASVSGNSMTIYQGGMYAQNTNGVIFHEMFHSIGYRHHETVEYAYTCDTCCFGEVDKNTRETACRICSSSYEGKNDLRYLKDLQRFSNAVGTSDAPTMISSTFYPLSQWIRELSLKDRNQLALVNIIALLGLNESGYSKHIAKTLLETALKKDNSPIFRKLQDKLASQFKYLFELNNEREFVDAFSSSVYSCYSKDLKTVRSSLKVLYTWNLSSVDFEDSGALSALSSCSIPGLVKTTDVIAVRFKQLTTFLKTELGQQ